MLYSEGMETRISTFFYCSTFPFLVSNPVFDVGLSQISTADFTFSQSVSGCITML